MLLTARTVSHLPACRSNSLRCRRRQQLARTGFTVIELLVVLAIIGLLLAVTIPAVQQMRESARQTQCLDHLHNQGLALQQHDATFGQLPRDSDHEWGVMAFLLPNLDEKPLYDQLQPTTTTRTSLAPALRPLLATQIPVLICPSFPEGDSLTPEGAGRTTYLGTRDLFSRRMSLTDVIDGESHTLAFGETKGQQAWAWPGLGDCSQLNQGAFGSYHPGGVGFVFCDGKAQLLNASIDPQVLQGLCSPQGRETGGSP